MSVEHNIRSAFGDRGESAAEVVRKQLHDAFGPTSGSTGCWVEGLYSDREVTAAPRKHTSNDYGLNARQVLRDALGN